MLLVLDSYQSISQHLTGWKWNASSPTPIYLDHTLGLCSMVARPMIESPYKVDIPATDVASFIFNSGTPTSRQAPQYFDAASPSKCFSFSEAEVFVKQAAKRLEALGLQPDDKYFCFHTIVSSFRPVMGCIGNTLCFHSRIAHCLY